MLLGHSTPSRYISSARELIIMVILIVDLVKFFKIVFVSTF